MHTPHTHARAHTHTHRMRLELEAEELTQAGDTESERLMDVYERLDELDASTAEVKAARILHGLGRFREEGRGGERRGGGREGGKEGEREGRERLGGGEERNLFRGSSSL